VSHNQNGSIHFLNDLRNRKGFSRACDTQQRLMFFTGQHTPGNLFNRRRLIPGYDAAVRAGMEAGAYGVTISGAGSALVAICARADVTTVAAAIVTSLSNAGSRSDPVAAQVAAEGVTVLP